MKGQFKRALGRSVLMGMMVTMMAFAGRADDDTASRTHREAFKVEKGDQLDITNKYGQIVVSTWDKDSLVVSVTVTAYGKTYSEARKILDRVAIDMDKTGQFITVESIFDRSSGFFTEFWNSVNEDSRALLSKSRLEINYQISVPENLRLNIDNRFGNVYVTELKTKANIKLSHGNLRANSLPDGSVIAVDFGDVRIKNLGSARLDLKATDTDIQKAGNLEMGSSSSTIRIIEAQNIRIDSRSDKDIHIEHLRSLKGNILFSETTLGNVSGEVDLEVTYTDLRLENLRFDVGSVDIRGKSSDIYLNVSKDAFMNLVLQGKSDEIYLPIEFKSLDRSVMDDKKGTVRLTGKIGKENNYPSSIRVDAQGGSIDIRWIAQASQETSVKND